MTLDNFDFSHLSASEQGRLAAAVTAARCWIEGRLWQQGVSMLLLAGAVENDPKRTGYGVGKTTIARAMWQATGITYGVEGLSGVTVTVIPGVFMAATDFLGRVDAGELLLSDRVCPVVVLDDWGRGGSLRWEKRDTESQTRARQEALFTLVDHCYVQKTSIVITASMTPAAFAVSVGGAVWSRLNQMAPKGYRFDLTGIPDWRIGQC